MLSRSTAPNSAQCAMRSVRVRCPRSSVSTATGRSTSFIKHSTTVYLLLVLSSKLGEENVRIRLARANGVDEKAESTTREPTPDEEEGSIVMEPPRNVSCGACRTRESDVWWKAPKGLPTSVLCDNCGLSWRKYADLNVRPMREETLVKAKPGDKREGTPPQRPPIQTCQGTLHPSSCFYTKQTHVNGDFRFGKESHTPSAGDISFTRLSTSSVPSLPLSSISAQIIEHGKLDTALVRTFRSVGDTRAGGNGGLVLRAHASRSTWKDQVVWVCVQD